MPAHPQDEGHRWGSRGRRGFHRVRFVILVAVVLVVVVRFVVVVAVVLVGRGGGRVFVDDLEAVFLVFVEIPVVVVVIVVSVGEGVDLHGPPVVVVVVLLVRVPELRDDLTGRHAQRLADLADVLARANVHDAPADEEGGILEGRVPADLALVRERARCVDVAAVRPGYRLGDHRRVIARGGGGGRRGTTPGDARDGDDIASRPPTDRGG
mmetsp:Transcript_11261/g.47001  ORF Transcript_11261/g.47001 Transcript_11261/m.47001 type:complete len:210 (-) Transcript_11261:137-766(-)